MTDKTMVDARATAIYPPVTAANTGPEGKRRPAQFGGLVLSTLFFYALPILFGEETCRVVLRGGALNTVTDLAILVSATLVSVLIHESGHLLMSLLAGFNFIGGALGPFRFSRFDGRWTGQFTGRNWFAASVSAIPRNASFWRSKMLAVVSAGPFATFTLLTVSAWALIHWNFGHVGVRFFAFAAELNAVLFGLGLVPNGSGARVRNDAALFVALLFNTPDSHNILLYHLVTQLKRQGSRPCFYPYNVIRSLAAADARREMAVLFAQTISDWALDRGDERCASSWDVRAVQLAMACEPLFYAQALAHSAVLDIVLRDDVVNARGKLSDIDLAVLQPQWLQHRTRAIQLLVAGDILEGMAELNRAEFSFPNRSPYFEYERGLLKRLWQEGKHFGITQTLPSGSSLR